MKDVTVRNAMTRLVQTITPSDSLEKAMNVLKRYGISGLPVVDSRQRVVGVLSEKDIARNLSEALGESSTSILELVLHTSTPKVRKSKPPSLADPEAKDIIRSTLKSVVVGDAMCEDPVVIGPGASLDSAARIMTEHHINRLPVVDGDRLVGIITRHDVLAAWV